jgi:hypothetical protein
MQPSNQLKGLVESYGSVYTNRQQTEELKQIAETIINCVGVHMVENGYVESDVKEFFEKSSIGKILEAYGEAVESEEVLQNVNESTGLYETHLRYIPGAMAARMKNESPEIVNRLASRLNEEDLHEFVGELLDKGKRKAREIASGAKKGLQGAVTGAGQAINRGIDKAASVATKIGQGAGQVAGNVKRTVQRELPRAVASTAGSALAGPIGGLAARGLSDALRGGGKTKTKTDSTSGSSAPSVKTTKTSGSGSGSGTGGGSGTRGGSGTTKSTAAPAPKPQTGDKEKDMASFAKANPKLAAKKKTFNPLMQRTFGYQTGNAPDQIAKRKAAAKAGSNFGSAISAGQNMKKNTAKAGSSFGSAIAAGQRMKKESSELDLVVQHLVSEGIASSLDGALVMIEGMSDQFINGILEQIHMGAAMVEFLIQNGEAQSIEEATYIISEMDEKNLDLLKKSIEG